MRSHEITLGRRFAVAFDHGEDFFTALADFCRTHDVRHGYAADYLSVALSTVLVAVSRAPVRGVARWSCCDLYDVGPW